MAGADASAPYDLAVVGGGVNGCGIARDAAGRGLSVILFEQDDLAGATSSASTKLIHGGLRYLERYEFRLVREALVEREALLRLAPHIIRPLRFVLPHHAGLRPAWMLRAGLFLYDHLGGRRILPGTRSLDLSRDPAGEPLKPGFRKAFEYSDCWVEDARLVVLTARDAAERGADIRPRMRAIAAEPAGDLWRLAVEDRSQGRRESVSARVLVNAAGPWVADVLGRIAGARRRRPVRLVQGSHIVVPRLAHHDRAYIFQNADKRVVFALPFETDFTLIGTTDRDFSGDPAAAAASAGEIDYLCAAANAYFRAQIAPGDVVWTYSGVRALADDRTAKAEEATRDYVLELDAEQGRPPLLSVFGGKITTFRRLAEAALDKLEPYLPQIRSARAGWTASAPLPGGDFPYDGFDALVRETGARFPFLAPRHATRLVRAYGTRAARLLDGARTAADLGARFGADLTQRELDYLKTEEWAAAADDVLWRRSKLGLRLSAAERFAVAEFLQTGRLPEAAAPPPAA